MPLAFALLGIAVLFVTSGLKGQTIADVFGGKSTGTLDPSGAHFTPEQLLGVNTSELTPTGGEVAVGLTGKVAALKAACTRMAAEGKQYKWAGGHLGFSQDGPWDCSGAVSQALHEAGFPIAAPLVSTAFMAYGKPGPGKHVTIAANPSHVFLIIDGQSWTTTSVGSSPKWKPHTTQGFVLRHPDGY
jgi:hypothetical protein